MEIIYTCTFVPVICWCCQLIYHQFDTNDYVFDRCWMANDKGLMWAFMGPALIVIVVSTADLYSLFHIPLTKSQSTKGIIKLT